MKSMFFELTLNVMMRMMAGKRYYGEGAEELEEERKFKEIVMTETLELTREEIDKEIGSKRVMEESDIGKLPYLHGIIKETLRMCLVTPLLIPHESSEECSVGGFCIPRGTMLLANTWAIQNDPGCWEQPSEFNPERFIRPEMVKNGFKMLPFGTGRRTSPGESLAMGLFPFTLGSLIQCFEWERIGEEMVDMSEGNGLTIPKAHPLLAKCTTPTYD
ncbi:Cytochrome P450 81D11 [Hibiscus syriacus]|uniref:Cytochrome P450 81D11 n=1 Tax=Hibiscus syriacus TaxID=106335 RepID=A0A6A2XSZ7_HIBSY|nr:Cytochrome P450 81D11 [Hibiscus syriacus]